MFCLNLYLHDSLLSDFKLQKVRSKIFSFAIIKNNSQGSDELAKSNYQLKKRQKELARKKKKDQKRHRKQDKDTINPEENPDQADQG